MTARPAIGLSLGAGALAAIAAVAAGVDGDRDVVPFFIGLTVAASVHAWSLVGASTSDRFIRWTIACAWSIAALWIGVLLLMYQAACACSMPPKPMEMTYLGLTATVYHLGGVYGGAVLVLGAGLLAERDQRRS